MLAVRDGDLDKMGVLFEKYNKQLYNFFLKQTRDAQASEDMVQEAFMKMLKYRHTYRGDGKFTTWMFSIAHNAMIDLFRKNKRRGETMSEEDLPEGTELASGAANPEELSVQADQHEALYKALDLLAPDKREALLLSRFENMKYKEIARIMGCKTGTVKARIHFALKDLTAIFSELTNGKTP
jgi:RNA polymerase sigma-70 factor (ECF subfamily)